MIWPGQTKLCSGPSHAEPVLLPLTSDHFYFNKTGRRAGRPLSRCKTCSNWEKLQTKNEPHGIVMIGSAELHPVRELVERCAGVRPAARRAGINRKTLKILLRASDPIPVRKVTMQRILSTLLEQRQYDREHGVSEHYLAVLQHRALMDGKLKSEYGI